MIRRGFQGRSPHLDRLHALFSTSAPHSSYDDTISNLRIGAHTRVIFQGFTGRQATANAKESLAWGTNIVGGVRPGKDGEHLGLPLLPTVREAMEKLKPDATGIYVAAHQASSAIEEAIEAEVPLIVAVAEHIPIHDMLRIHSMLKSQSRSRLVGANAPGIISAVGRCRIGFQPLPCFTPGRVGIIAKSGTLSYEAVASTTRAGLGQSLCIGMGGDVLAGTTFTDALEIFEHDDDTEGIVLIGEIGGTAELEAANWVKDYKTRVPNPKPISALVGGIHATFGRVMGHAGAFILPGEPDALTKVKHLEDAGVTVVNHPAKFGDTMKALLGNSGRANNRPRSTGVQQRRQIHSTSRLRPMTSTSTAKPPTMGHRRYLYIGKDPALGFLRERGVSTEKYPANGIRRRIAITIDRKSSSPCILASPTNDREQSYAEARRFIFSYQEGFDPSDIHAVAGHLQIDRSARRSLLNLINKLFDIFVEKEAFLLETDIIERSGDLVVVGARIGFDEAAFRTAGRQSDVHALCHTGDKDAQELEAEKDGIVYVKLAGDGNIGTLVNGAGLAMNTVDALADAGGRAANFLDTGGKATSETVKKSFQAVLQDVRVRVIFVNVFGGLTLGDMVAQGILLAFKELDVGLPVVVRIRGTNEEEGQRMIAESGLRLHAFDDFEQAAAKAIDLARDVGSDEIR